MSRVYIKEHFPYLSGNDNIIIDDSAPVTITQTYERLSEISNLGGVVIDYFQLIQSEDATISGVSKQAADVFLLPFDNSGMTADDH